MKNQNVIGNNIQVVKLGPGGIKIQDFYVQLDVQTETELSSGLEMQ